MTTFADLLDQIRTATTMAGLNRAYEDALDASFNQYRTERPTKSDAAGEYYVRREHMRNAYAERAARGGFVA